MNHPIREEWMSYLYDELSPEEHARLETHLAACPDCKIQMSVWRSARKDLDGWQVHSTRSHRTTAGPLIKWAAAAAILLAAGMSVGRLTSATADAGKLRAAIEPGIRQQLERDFARMLRDGLSESSTTTLAASRDSAKQVFEEYLKAVEAKRAEDYQNFSAALNKLESQRVADYVSLKQDLDTVAVTTDAGLRRTQQQLVRLADYTQPTDNLNSTAK